MNYINYYKQLRLMLIYDLPMKEETDKKSYSKFHNRITRLGFYMIQYSVYTKVLTNESNYIQIKNKLNTIVPDSGSIIIFKITEKQFQDLIYLRGVRNKFESIVGGNEFVVFRGERDD